MSKSSNSIAKCNSVFVAPNGRLYKETKMFWKASNEIEGICITELWSDAYERNLENINNVVLIPAEV